MSEQRPMPPGPDQIMAAAQTVHDRVRAAYDKNEMAAGQLKLARQELDKLAKLGDMVSEDDVIGAAGRLVGHGLGAPAMAELLASMPTEGGQALAAWIGAQDEHLRQHEFMVEHVGHGLRHQLGQSAMRVLAAAELKSGQPQQPVQSGAGESGGNPLAMGAA